MKGFKKQIDDGYGPPENLALETLIQILKF